MSLRDISDITRLGVVKKIIEVIDYFMSNDIDASRIKGQLDISNIPPAGLDNVIKVDTVTDMLALTVDDVQNGDTVMIIGVTPPVQYQVVDDTKLGTMDAFQEYAAGTATKALADINGNNIHTTYGKLAGNNTWTGSNTYNRNIYVTNGSSAGSSGTLYLGVKPANETVQARIGTDKLGGLFYHASTNQPHVFRVGTNNNVFVIRDDDTKVAFSSNNNFFATVTHDGVAKWLGNANTATKLQTARTINGVSFDGTANITIADSTKLPIAGGTMTGDLTLKGNPTADLMAATKKYVDDSVASAGYGDVLAAGNNSFTGANTFKNLVTMVGGVVFTSGTTTLAWKNATQIVATINASTYTGNSATATKLQTARTINGVSFDGTANITIADSTKLPIAGGTMTGDLTLKGNPTADLMAATKKYVDDSVASAGYGDVLAAGNNSFTGANTFKNLVTMVGGVVFTSGTTTLAWKNATQIVATINASTYTGNSATATKLATARTITANLASSTAGSFDGSANITVGVTGTLPIANGGTGATTAAAARTALGCAPAYTYSTTDLTAGSSALTTGTLYIVYE